MDDYTMGEDFEILKRIAEVYESLPPESVALVLANSNENSDFDVLDTEDQVLVSVVDNLPEGFKKRLVFYLAHGILQMIEDNFEDLIEAGRDRALLQEAGNMEENEIQKMLGNMEENELIKNSENVIVFDPKRKKK